MLAPEEGVASGTVPQKYAGALGRHQQFNFREKDIVEKVNCGVA